MNMIKTLPKLSTYSLNTHPPNRSYYLPSSLTMSLADEAAQTDNSKTGRTVLVLLFLFIRQYSSDRLLYSTVFDNGHPIKIHIAA